MHPEMVELFMRIVHTHVTCTLNTHMHIHKGGSDPSLNKILATPLKEHQRETVNQFYTDGAFFKNSVVVNFALMGCVLEEKMKVKV